MSVEKSDALNKKLKEYLDKLDNDNFDKLTTPLFHYTNYKGLSGILKNQELWMTNHRYLNDPSEISHGENIILNLIKRKLAKNESLESLMKCFLKDLIERYTTYLTSFCEEGDYLPAWRYYGDNGAGFSIGFRPEYFKPKPQVNKIHATMLYKINYEDSSEVKKIFEIAHEIYPDWASKSNSNKHLFIDMLINYLISFLPSMKNKDYHDEKEWRLCLIRFYINETWHPYELPMDRLFIAENSNPQITPYVRNYKTAIPRLRSSKFKFDDIATIFVGPRLDFVSAKLGIQKMLLDAGIDSLEKILIKKSERPYQ